MGPPGNARHERRHVAHENDRGLWHLRRLAGRIERLCARVGAPAPAARHRSHARGGRSALAEDANGELRRRPEEEDRAFLLYLRAEKRREPRLLLRCGVAGPGGTAPGYGQAAASCEDSRSEDHWQPGSSTTPGSGQDASHAGQAERVTGPIRVGRRPAWPW